MTITTTPPRTTGNHVGQPSDPDCDGGPSSSSGGELSSPLEFESEPVSEPVAECELLGIEKNVPFDGCVVCRGFRDGGDVAKPFCSLSESLLLLSEVSGS